MKIFRRYADTLGFLTRLAPARVIEMEEMNKCMAYMPAVGVTLGVVIVLPFWLGLFSGSAWIQAWLMVMLSIFLTRGLHYDGISDVADAVTTHTDPDRFWEVIKDSRCGAFGVVALVMGLGGQVLLLHEMIAVGAYGAVAFTFILGRGACVGFGYFVKDMTRPGLGKLYIDGATLGVALVSCLGCAFLGFWLAGPLAAVAGMALATAALVPLYRLATHVGAANGDFLGAAVILGEICAGLGFVAFM